MNDCHVNAHAGTWKGAFVVMSLAPSLTVYADSVRPELATWLHSNSVMTTRPQVFCP